MLLKWWGDIMHMNQCFSGFMASNASASRCTCVSWILNANNFMQHHTIAMNYLCSINTFSCHTAYLNYNVPMPYCLLLSIIMLKSCL